SGEVTTIYSTYPGVGGGQTVTGTEFAIQSTFTLMLPYMEHNDAYQAFDLLRPYNAPANVASSAGKVPVATFLCPTNPVRPKSGPDANGYGYTDYMPLAYIDTAAPASPQTAPGGFVRFNNDATPKYRFPGALALKNSGGFYDMSGAGSSINAGGPSGA